LTSGCKPPRPMTAPLQESPHKGKTGLKRVWNAMFYSFDGLRSAWKHEDAFRQETILALLMVPLAFLLTGNNVARAIMIASVLLVLIVELVNSAIEATVDRISLDMKKLDALVSMKIKKDVVLTDDVIASVKTAGLIGDKYIKLSPGGSEDYIGDRGALTDTESAISLEELVSKYMFQK